jgi:hypothetical protein
MCSSYNKIIESTSLYTDTHTHTHTHISVLAAARFFLWCVKTGVVARVPVHVHLYLCSFFFSGSVYYSCSSRIGHYMLCVCLSLSVSGPVYCGLCLYLLTTTTDRVVFCLSALCLSLCLVSVSLPCLYLSALSVSLCHPPQL